MDQGVSVLDGDLKFVAWYPQYERIFDLPQGFMKAGPPFESIVRYLHSAGYFGQRDMEERRQNAIDKPRPGDAFELPLPGGRYLDVRRSGLPDGGIVTTYTDITERRRAENLTRLLGMQDPLTQLANRAQFLENLVAAIGEGAWHNFQVGLMIIDLDHFKPVNDTHGLRIQIGGSIGNAFFPDHGRSPNALIAKAAKALYTAKAAGRNCIRRIESIGTAASLNTRWRKPNMAIHL